MESFSAGALREDFPGLAGVVPLNSASMGCPPRVALEALASRIELLRDGPRGRPWAGFIDDYEWPVEEARREAAVLLGASGEEVGLVSDTTAGLHHAIDAIPFRAGDNVVLSDLEYPQVALAARNAAREHGVELRFVTHREGRVDLDQYRQAVDGKTRALLLSAVGWVTGQRFDLGVFSELAAERDLFLVIDAVQQLGVRSLDCSALRIDFLAAGGYKWLNAPFGAGLFYVSRRTHERGLRVRRVGLAGLEPPSEGWAAFFSSPAMRPLPPMDPSRTVRRFEAQGTANRLGAAGLAASLAYRNRLPAAAADRHVLDLGAELIAALRTRGARVWTPEVESERAGVVTFTFGGDASADDALRHFLEARGIYVSARYCSGVGGVRVAIHYFNTADDIRELLAAVDDFRGGRR